jgi:predicted MFS family arabinose efflux permease
MRSLAGPAQKAFRVTVNKSSIPPLNPVERRAAAGLAGIYAARMLGLFLILPVFAIYAKDLKGQTPLLIGVAIGAYGLTQAILQIPFGMLSDRIGRKPVIYGGLALFVLGSVIAAMSGTIHGVILGRIFQGAGAVSAAVTALVADLTRDEVRTRAMAGIGASIGISFALALILGPTIGDFAGLSGIFWVTAALAFSAMLVLAFVVPNPDRRSIHRDAEPVADQLGGVLRDGQLLRLDLGIFVLHLIMTGVFLVVPPALVKAGIPVDRHWTLYLPVLVASVAVMVPFVIQAESKGRMKPVFAGAVAALGLSVVAFALAGAHLAALIAVLVAFFGAVNLLESLLPSIITKTCRAGAKGTAMGVYSTSQFLGAFAGGALGGLVNQAYGADGVFVLGAVAALAWLAAALTMRPPERVTARTVDLTARLVDAGPGAALALQRELLAVPGVRDAVVVPAEGAAYLKVDSHELDSARLQAVCG